MKVNFNSLMWRKRARESVWAWAGVMVSICAAVVGVKFGIPKYIVQFSFDCIERETEVQMHLISTIHVVTLS